MDWDWPVSKLLGKDLNLADPLAVLPNRFQRGEISPVENILCCSYKLSAFGIVPGVTGADRHELQDAGIAVTVNHAAGAAVPDEL